LRFYSYTEQEDLLLLLEKFKESFEGQWSLIPGEPYKIKTQAKL